MQFRELEGKTGERLVLELKNKVDQVSEEGTKEIPLSIKNEAAAAFTTLGYNSKVADKIIRDILSTDPNLSLEELIKRSLSNLNK